MSRLTLSVIFTLLLSLSAVSNAFPASAQDATPTAGPTQYPLTIENCGTTLTFERAPERILATYQSVAEILVALGLTEKIVGVTYGIAYPPPAGYEMEVNGLNWMTGPSEGQASREAVLSVSPDFVLVAYPEYDLDGSAGYATREDYESIGASVFSITDQCLSDASASTVETVFADVLTLGQIFDVQEQANELVESMRGRIESITSRIADEPVDVAFVDFGSTDEIPSPLPVYGAGLNADMIRLAGGHNVFGDGADTYFTVSLEEVALLEIEVLALLDTSPPYYEAVEQRAALFFSTFPEVPASQHMRYVAVDPAAFAAGIRIPDAIETMARAFHPGAFPDAASAQS